MHGVFYAVNLMAGTTTSYKFHTTRAYHTLPDGLVVVHRLDTLQGDFCHLDIEDAFFLHKATVGNGELGTCTDYPTGNTNNQTQKGNSKPCIYIYILFFLIVACSGCCQTTYYH